MTLLVVTPTLGASPWLAETVASVRRVAPEARHVIVCPAGAAEALRSAYPASEVVTDPPGANLYSALNHAVRGAEGWEWMTYVNDDDTLLPGFATAFAAHRAAGVAAIGYGDVTYVSASGRALGRAPVERNPRRLARLARALVAALAQPGTIVPRAAFEQLGGFDPAFDATADFDFWVRAMAAGIPFTYRPIDVATYRVRRGQIAGDWPTVRAQLARSVQRLGAERCAPCAVAARLAYWARNAPRHLARLRRTGRLRTIDLFANPPE